MRTFALKNADTGERYSLMSVDHYFSDPKGLGTNYDISGATTGDTFVVANKRRAINAPSGNMIFSNYTEYDKFIDFCKCKNLQFCYTTNSGVLHWSGTDISGIGTGTGAGGTVQQRSKLKINSERMMDVSLASCEKTESEANGMLICPVTFNGLSQWYYEDIITDERFLAFDALFEHAEFDLSDLIHIGKQGVNSEVSFTIGFSADQAQTSYLMEIGLVYREKTLNGETERRELICSIGDHAFEWNYDTDVQLVVNSSPQNIAIYEERFKFGTNPKTAEHTEKMDLYKYLDPSGNNPFIRTDKDIYMFICAIDEDGNRKRLKVEARCKRFVESV